uniref:Uncharacterized protein n=1 Tax=Anopheles atroparvus TaxID=41427 RepID=A0AAG5D5Z3_ANOAO
MSCIVFLVESNTTFSVDNAYATNTNINNTNITRVERPPCLPSSSIALVFVFYYVCALSQQSVYHLLLFF